MTFSSGRVEEIPYKKTASRHSVLTPHDPACTIIHYRIEPMLDELAQ